MHLAECVVSLVCNLMAELDVVPSKAGVGLRSADGSCHRSLRILNFIPGVCLLDFVGARRDLYM